MLDVGAARVFNLEPAFSASALVAQGITAVASKPCPSPDVELCLRANSRFRAGLGILRVQRRWMLVQETPLIKIWPSWSGC